jgi:hypothetical protein
MRDILWERQKRVVDSLPQRPSETASKPKGLQNCDGIAKCAKKHVAMKTVLSVIA